MPPNRLVEVAVSTREDLDGKVMVEYIYEMGGAYGVFLHTEFGPISFDADMQAAFEATFGGGPIPVFE